MDAKALLLKECVLKRIPPKGEGLHPTVKKLTDSSYGFIAEVRKSENSTAYLQALSITNISWDKATRDFYEAYVPTGLRFDKKHGLNTEPYRSGLPVFSNDPLNDPRSCCLPKGHPPLKTYMGLPLKSGDEIVGIIALANREDGYDQTIVDFLDPVSLLGAQLIVSIRDQREKQEAQFALKQSDDNYRTIFEAANDAFFIHGVEDWIIEKTNNKAVDMYGFSSKEELIGLSLMDLSVGASSHPTAEIIQLNAMAMSGEPQLFEWYAKGKGNRVFWVEVNLKKIVVGSDYKMLSVVRGISERKESEFAIQKAKEEAVRANRAKSAFLATMSHEIRTPLNAILGMGEVLDDTKLTDTQQWCVTTLNRSGEALLTLINDILDLSKIEADQVKLENVAIDLHHSITDTIELFTFTALDKGIKLSNQVEENVPLWVFGDPSRLRQVLLNLINNAIKFTKEGQVSLRVKSGDGDDISFAIADTGIGISTEKQGEIFQPFTQADISTTRKHGGTGLGLAICLRLVHLMGGEITLQSEIGQGSTFTFTVPLPRVTQEKIQVLEVAKAKASEKSDITQESGSLNILLADDAEDNRMVVQAYLNNSAHNITMVENGAEAVMRFKEGGFDLVLMDIQMPVLDGYEATRQIRLWETETNVEPVPIVALTAHAMVEETHRITEAGCDLHLAKPIRKKLLLSVISRFQHKKSVPIIHVQPPSPLVLETSKADNISKQNEYSPAINSETIEQLRQDLGGYIDFTLRKFIEKLPKRLDAIAKALQQGKAEDVSKTAHKLKGVAATIGADKLTAICHELELSIGADKPLNVDMFTTSILNEGERVQTEIEAILSGATKHSKP
jgi:PAS domain S-box-containing protein